MLLARQLTKAPPAHSSPPSLIAPLVPRWFRRILTLTCFQAHVRSRRGPLAFACHPRHQCCVPKHRLPSMCRIEPGRQCLLLETCLPCGLVSISRPDDVYDHSAMHHLLFSTPTSTTTMEVSGKEEQDRYRKRRCTTTPGSAGVTMCTV